jgi:aminoglycoside phosphotransferase (APT) family kinase protein
MFYVMSFKKGRIFDNAMAAAEPGKRTPLLLKVVETLARLHGQDVERIGLADCAATHM